MTASPGSSDSRRSPMTSLMIARVKSGGSIASTERTAVKSTRPAIFHLKGAMKGAIFRIVSPVVFCCCCFLASAG